MSARRLPAQPYEWIDRDQTFAFEFEGTTVQACEGDVISSALLASGRQVLGRSFKYHRPRSVLSFANHDVNVLVETRDRTNLRADVEAPVAGARYTAVNTHGGVDRDRLRFLGRFAPLLPVGFYYKAFFRPRFGFAWWERLIRGLTGLGQVNPGMGRERTPLRRDFCDVLVIGGGVAGLAAARVLAANGVNAIVCDENLRPGGSVTYVTPADPAIRGWLDETLAELAAAPALSLRARTYAGGIYPGLAVPLVDPERAALVQPRAIIVASGAIEQPAVFHNNDVPGVMLASAAQRLIHRYAVAPCARAVVLAANVDGYVAALDLQAAGISIAALVDLEDPGSRGGALAAVRAAGIAVHGRSCVTAATAGADGVLARVEIGPWHPGMTASGGSTRTVACDGLLMSVGWQPAVQLLTQAGATLAFDETVGQLRPATLPPGVFAAGRVNGVYAFEDRVADGAAAAAEALGFLGRALPGDAPRPPSEPTRRSHPAPFVPHRHGKNFVDFDEDVQLGDLEVAAREGFDHVELLKRFTTNGMGPSQGKHSNLNAARFLGNWHGRPLSTLELTTQRPFYHPTALGKIAGRRCRPVAVTALHDWHAAHGATFLEAGAWLRPSHYGAGAAADAIRAEVLAVRSDVGLVDVSTLGKFDLIGPGAAELLDHVYTSRVSALAVGRSRYVILTDARGVIADDGVVARFDDEHYLVTAGSGHAAATLRTLLQVRDLFGLDCELIDRSRDLAAINVAGPGARALLQPLTEVDLDEAAFPFLAVRRGAIVGVDARLVRVGFVGELGYEIHLPWSAATALWERLVATGARAFGVDAQRVLRLEKGHLIVGQDTDGVTTPFDVGLGGMVNFAKPQFLGRAALALLRADPARCLVGFALDCSAGDLAESHLVIANGAIAGRVTSVAMSPTLNRTIGLASVTLDLAAVGTPLKIRGAGGRVFEAAVVETPFYDPENLRQRMATEQAA